MYFSPLTLYGNVTGNLLEIYGILEESCKFPVKTPVTLPYKVRWGANERGGVSTWYTGSLEVIITLGI